MNASNLFQYDGDSKHFFFFFFFFFFLSGWVGDWVRTDQVFKSWFLRAQSFPKIEDLGNFCLLLLRNVKKKKSKQNKNTFLVLNLSSQENPQMFPKNQGFKNEIQNQICFQTCDSEPMLFSALSARKYCIFFSQIRFL